MSDDLRFELLVHVHMEDNGNGFLAEGFSSRHCIKREDVFERITVMVMVVGVEGRGKRYRHEHACLTHVTH